MSISPVIPAEHGVAVSGYRRLRPILTELHSGLFRLIRKDALFACAKRLRMLTKQDGKKVIIFEHEFEMDIFQDYLIYMYRPAGTNAIQQMMNHNRYKDGSDERRLLEGMAKAHFSIFLVKELIKPTGFIGLDIYTGEEFFIMDQTLPRRGVIGLLIGFRIFPFDGYWMHTGANLTLGEAPDDAGFKPLEKRLTVEEEQQLNEETIFRWRKIVREMAE